jgi:glycosyltransferase involved in cell wall biosynthesis
MALPATPTVTVVIQTFNRCNILPYCIGSVLRQTHGDFELLVIGDHCTDDTAAVVARFEDPRVRFVNLPERVGDQSGPNNEGHRLARGRYIAYLNHDDLWLPDHLERTVRALDASGADLVFTLQIEIDPDGHTRINAAFPEGRFDPVTHPNASTWVFRRDLADRIGPQKTRARVFSYPTREWLWRAHLAGASLRAVTAATVVVISATTRRNVYVDLPFAEQQRAFEEIAGDPGFRERKLLEAWVNPRPTHLRAYPSRLLLRALAMRWIGRLARMFGLDPEAAYCYHKVPKKWGFLPSRGALIRELYRRRGLAPWNKM